MKVPRMLVDLALSGLASYVATRAMEPVSMKLYELESDVARAREDAARTGPPYAVANGLVT